MTKSVLLRGIISESFLPSQHCVDGTDTAQEGRPQVLLRMPEPLGAVVSEPVDILIGSTMERRLRSESRMEKGYSKSNGEELKEGGERKDECR